MAWSKVGASDANFSSGVTSRVITRTPGAVGNLLIVAFDLGQFDGTPTISDTAGNTWNVLNPIKNDATNATTTLSWYAVANGTSSTTITVQSNSAAQYCTISFDEFTGGAAAPLDQVVNSATGANGTPISPTITPSVNDCLFWAWCADSTTNVGLMDGVTATQGSIDNDGERSEYRILSGRAGIGMTAAFVGSGAFNVMAATFKPLTGSLISPDVGPLSFVGRIMDIIEEMRNNARIVIRKA